MGDEVVDLRIYPLKQNIQIYQSELLLFKLLEAQLDTFENEMKNLIIIVEFLRYTLFTFK